MKRKTRKMGTPKRSGKKARTHTTPADLQKKPASPLDTATISELEHLVADAPPEVQWVGMLHRMARPGDAPGANLERYLLINKATGQTFHQVRKIGDATWHYENIAARRRTSPSKRP
jgi:hypothetical protein